jgi:hypothetical protein
MFQPLEESDIYNWKNFINELLGMICHPDQEDMDMWSPFIEKSNFHDKCDEWPKKLDYFVVRAYTSNNNLIHVILDEYNTLEKSLDICQSISIWTKDKNNCPFVQIIHGDYNSGKLSLLKIMNITEVLNFFTNFEIDIT